MKNSGGLKTEHSQDAWKVWGLKPLSKLCGSGFAKICSGNRRSCPESWTYRPNQCRAWSGTINTWQCTAAQRDTSLFMLWRRSNGQEHSITSSGTLRTGTKTSSSRMRKIFHRGAVQPPEQEDLWSNVLWGEGKRSEGAGRPSPSYVMVWWEVSHHGVTHLHFCKKGVKLVPECIKRTCYKELRNILTWPPSVVRNGSSSVTQYLPKGPRQLRSGCGGTFWPSSAPRIGFRGVQTSNPWTINCGLFWRIWCAKSIRTAWRAWGGPLWRQRQRSPWRQSVQRQHSGRSISRLASRHRTAILSDIIINENLKLLQINYLAKKWMFRLIFLLGHIELVTQLMARLCIIILNLFSPISY